MAPGYKAGGCVNKSGDESKATAKITRMLRN